jgi:hypothetical protein
MNLEGLIEEVYDQGPQRYGGFNSAPRKDFAPLPSKDGYNYPYQQNPPLSNLTTPPPEGPVAYPWPLQTIVDDLSDSFVCLLNAASKIADCAKNNPSIDNKQQNELFEFYKSSKQALEIIKNIGTGIGNVVNMSEGQPSQNPVAQQIVQKNETLPQAGDIVKIKIP